MKTKIFAGGAMIAEQNAVLARMEWTSADPVTGSSAKILRSGLFVDEERKELEPLGQEILPIEPPNEQPAPSPENVRFSAQESEWQCKASEARFGREDFFSKPIHCQKAALAANTASFDDLHPSRYSIVTIEYIPNMPSTGLWNSTADKAMSYSLRSTSKKTDDEGDDSEPCKYDDKGRPECVVQSEGIEYDPIAFNDAENGDFGDRGRKLSGGEVKKLMADAQLILDINADCKSLIEGILKNVESTNNPVVSSNIMNVISQVQQQRGFYVVENLDAGGYSWGAIGKETAKMELNFVDTTPPAHNYYRKGSLAAQKYENNFRRTKELVSASTVLNEAIHLSGKNNTYDDYQMSVALSKYLEKPLPNYGDKPKDASDVKRWNTAWSGWWHPKIMNICNTKNVLIKEGLYY